MEKESGTTKKKTTWSTWEELLLAFAVKRHGLKDWESVAMELQSRSSLPALLTAQICKDKYRDLRRRFINNNNSYDDEKINDGFDDGDVTIPWIEELRQLRVAELKQEVQRYDLSIQSLQLKLKKMEEEREQSLKDESLDDGQKPDLEDVKEERSQNDNNSGADGKPEESTGKAGSSEESDRENRSFNESNSTENRDIGVKNEPEPVETGEFRPVQEVKPVSEEDSYNGSSSDRQEEKKISRESGESKEETKENSDVQSTATLTKKRWQRGGRSGGDAVEAGSPAVGLNKGQGAAKSEPLIEFLDIIRSHKRGSMFKRRLDSQKTDKYKSMIRQHVDLETVQARIDDGSYCSCPSKFYLDLLLIFNNAIVYFPKSSPESTAANELRGIVMEELKKNRTQPKDPSPGPGPLRIQPKPELERSDSLLAKHKSTAPIVVCRKRSSISAKAAASGTNKPEKQAEIKPPLNPKPPIKTSSNEEESSIKLGMKEKPVTGVRSMRRSNKGRPNNNASQSNNNQTTNTKQTNTNADKKEEAKMEKKKEEAKKRGAAADFLKRIKKNSPTKGTLMEALKNPTEDVVVKGNKREHQKKKVDERRETPVRRSGGSGGGGGKEEGSPSKRSVGRPPKRGGKETVQEKRGRENSEKDDSSIRPKKRSRR
ncbi:uncharacterized protein LOC107819199 [Nicotiana tabacum]|uniref:Bromodomain-containing protein DDB_G0270170 n=1 Tax=Nicotiana tabacum TaxID=4097 RepID=A0A1S4CHY2_TOBAC|nr:PREDICTED: bromodomain-containing protein DDB_G0270170-like [Nicotiana tabacum]